MWGDATSAAALNHVTSTSTNNTNTDTASSNTAASSLLQITSPLHIPLNDNRWQELFLCYDVLVHLDLHRTNGNGNGTNGGNGGNGGTSSGSVSVMQGMATSMNHNTRLSHNMAGYTWHLTRMMQELISSCEAIVTTTVNVNANANSDSSSGNNNNSSGGSGDIKCTGSDAEKSMDTSCSSSKSASQSQSRSRGGRSKSSNNKVKASRNKNKNGTIPVPVPVNMNTASQKIALVGRTRVICGALNLYRIFIHEIITQACHNCQSHGEGEVDGEGASNGKSESESEQEDQNVNVNVNVNANVAEVFLFQSRRSQDPRGHMTMGMTTNMNMNTNMNNMGMRAGVSTSEINNEKEAEDVDMFPAFMEALLSFLSLGSSGSGSGSSGRGSDSQNENNNENNKDMKELIHSTAELYDATMMCLNLVLVLVSVQLYQPMQSSFQKLELEQLELKQLERQRRTRSGSGDGGHYRQLQQQQQQQPDMNFALDYIMSSVSSSVAVQSQNSYNSRSNSKRPHSHSHSYSARSILSICLHWMTHRPPPPPNSITAHHVSMAQFIAQNTNGMGMGGIMSGSSMSGMAADGMYESHMIVMANHPTHVAMNMKAKKKIKDKGGHTDTTLSRGSGNSSASASASGWTGAGGLVIMRDATHKVMEVSSSLLLLPIRLMVLALKALGTNRITGGNNGGGGSGGSDKERELRGLLGAHMNMNSGSSSSSSSSSIPSPTNDVLWLSDSPIADMASSLFLILTNNHRCGDIGEKDHHDNGDGDGDGDVEDYAEADDDDQIQIQPLRNNNSRNAFRTELASLDDNRWGGRAESISNSMNGFLQGGGSEPSERSGSGGDVFETVSLQDGLQEDAIGRSSLSRLGEDITHRNGNSGGNVGGLTINFEELFHSFGGILHNEVGSLVLYTLLQSSPIFAKSLAVRSGNDLENLVLPLLRTLYVSSSSSHHISGRTTMSRSKGTEVQVMERPFRSPSQLYVILILLLIFSQDASFPTDSFRRSNIPHVVWYKERQLKNISLGSLLVLSLLRCITFNLNRMQDPFLLSNCCAVLLNLSPNIANLHSYASMRLVSVLLATMKRYTVLVMKNGGRVAGEEDVTSLLGMYSEACRILLQVVKHAVRRKIVDRNLHLVYALVYHRRDLNTIVKAKSTPFRPVDTEKIRTVIAKADELIQGASARRADESMKVLEQNVHVLKGTHASSSRGTRSRLNSESSHSEGGSGASVASLDSTISDSTMNGMEDFKFTYEEEGDPETFFVPYIWDVIVSTVTSNTLEWDRMNIEVFPIMHHVEMTMEMGGIAGSGTVNDDETVVNSKSGFATDIGDVV